MAGMVVEGSHLQWHQCCDLRHHHNTMLLPDFVLPDLCIHPMVSSSGSVRQSRLDRRYNSHSKFITYPTLAIYAACGIEPAGDQGSLSRVCIKATK